MKRIHYFPKIFLAAALCLAAFAARTQNYGVNLEPLCWATPGGVDSTIYVAWLDAAATTKPTRLHYFNVSGLAVTVTGGTLRPGYCGTAAVDSLILKLDSLIYPQMCECEYRIDLYNQTLTVDTNATQPIWAYTQTVLRDCGAGEEVVYTQETETPVGKAYHLQNTTTNMTNGNGVLDSIKLHYADAADSFFYAYMSPTKVAANYPTWTGDTSDLRFFTATPGVMEAALEDVLNFAIEKWATDNGVASPMRDFNVVVNSSGAAFIYFYLFHHPTSTYINFRNGNTLLRYHSTSATSHGVVAMGYAGLTKNQTHTWATPCGLNVSTSYQCIVNTSADVQVAFDSIELISPLDTNQFVDVHQTCEQLCPYSACTEICNTSDNPIPVTIVQNATECDVQNIAESRSISSSSQSITSNYYHSVSIAITTGTVAVTTVNGSNIQTVSFTAPAVVTWTAPDDCSLLSTGFGVNATSGAAIVATIR